MGIRIGKQIGYFISVDKFSSIIVDNYEEIIENIDLSDDGADKVFEQLALVVQEYKDYRTSGLDAMPIKILIRKLQEKKIALLDIINMIYFYDDFQGLLFSTPDMTYVRRYDDSIDYYESTDMLGKINYLHRPIYPVSGFVYQGGLEKYNITHMGKELVIGETYYEHVNTLAFKINHQVYEDKYDANSSDVYYLFTNNNYFHPAVDSLMYTVAKAAGLLKPDVTFKDFQFAVHPAIVETWN